MLYKIENKIPKICIPNMLIKHRKMNKDKNKSILSEVYNRIRKITYTRYIRFPR